MFRRDVGGDKFSIGLDYGTLKLKLNVSLDMGVLFVGWRGGLPSILLQIPYRQDNGNSLNFRFEDKKHDDKIFISNR